MTRRRTPYQPLVAVACALALTGFHEPRTEPPDQRELIRALEGLEAIQLATPRTFVRQLRAVILESPNPYLRERGIATMTEIAIRRKETQRIVPFLEELALDGETDSVRSSAYANLELIRAQVPVEQRGSLELAIHGEMGKGRSVKLVATVSSPVDLEADVTIGLSSLPEGVEMLARSDVRKVFLEANRPKRVAFELRLNETGRYFIPVAALFSFSRTDSERVKKRGYLVVNESSGRFTVPEEPQRKEKTLVKLH